MPFLCKGAGTDPARISFACPLGGRERTTTRKELPRPGNRRPRRQESNDFRRLGITRSRHPFIRPPDGLRCRRSRARPDRAAAPGFGRYPARSRQGRPGDDVPQSGSGGFLSTTPKSMRILPFAQLTSGPVTGSPRRLQRAQGAISPLSLPLLLFPSQPGPQARLRTEHAMAAGRRWTGEQSWKRSGGSPPGRL